MRGRQNPQVSMLPLIDKWTRIPLDHSQLTIKKIADDALQELSPEKALSSRKTRVLPNELTLVHGGLCL